MKVNDELLNGFFSEGKKIGRSSWPAGDYLIPDPAEGGNLWYYSGAMDELIEGYSLGYSDLSAGDWEFRE